MMTWLVINAVLFGLFSTLPAPGQFSIDAESMAITGKPAKTVIACTYLYVASFATTWGPVSWSKGNQKLVSMI